MQAACFSGRGLTLRSRGLAPASRVKPLTSNVRPRYSRIQMPVLAEPSSRDRTAAKTSVRAFARAARPLASGARSSPFVAGASRKAKTSLTARPQSKECAACLCALKLACKATQALRRGAKPKSAGRAGTSFARAGGFGMFASGATQRTMRAGVVLLHPRPNPSVKGTHNGGLCLLASGGSQPPLCAPYLKR